MIDECKSFYEALNNNDGKVNFNNSYLDFDSAMTNDVKFTNNNDDEVNYNNSYSDSDSVMTNDVHFINSNEIIEATPNFATLPIDIYESLDEYISLADKIQLSRLSQRLRNLYLPKIWIDCRILVKGSIPELINEFAQPIPIGPININKNNNDIKKNNDNGKIKLKPKSAKKKKGRNRGN